MVMLGHGKPPLWGPVRVLRLSTRSDRSAIFRPLIDKNDDRLCAIRRPRDRLMTQIKLFAESKA